MRLRRAVLLFALLLSSGISGVALAQHHGGHRNSSSAYSHKASPENSHHARIHRSAAAKDSFMRSSGYPHGRKGYVVDHIVPLACGGSDSPSNMQWQTKADAKAKDKWERNGCK